jgi:YVTN family beta-propeller protein
MHRMMRAAPAATALLAVTVLPAPAAYVPNESSGSVSVVDIASEKGTQTFRIGRRPRGVAVALDGK